MIEHFFQATSKGRKGKKEAKRVVFYVFMQHSAVDSLGLDQSSAFDDFFFSILAILQQTLLGSIGN